YIFYRPARKTRDIDLGFGEQPKESVSASPELIGARKNLVKENQSIFLSRTQNDLLVPTKKQEIRIIPEKAPEETNILGRRGKPPVKTSNPLDITQTPRSEFVERGNIRPENEVFTSRGQKIKNEYGDVLFGDLTKPQGALRSSPKSAKTSKPIIDLEPQKEYQDWRFQKFSSKGPFNYGFRTGKPPKEVNLEERKDYQDWRFSKFLEKNPQPEKVGDTRFQSFVDTKLPKVNKKAPVYSSFFKESKAKVPKSSSAKLFETKPKQETKGTEFKNTGSKQETVLIQKPLQKRRLVSSQEQQYESNYEFRPVPTSKSESASILGLKSEVLPRFATKTDSKQESGSLISNMFKNLEKERLGPKSGLKSNQGLGLTFRQTPKQGTRQTPDLITSPKQSTKPKQTIAQAPKFPNPKVSKSIFKFSEKPLQGQRVKTTNEYPKPPKALLPVLFGPVGRKPRGKNSSGPTALYRLNVNNIFSSSLSIDVGKNRVEF
ncbi:MAG: hypothetical protein KGI08_09945, partial [Thaumarchaeota archaeon]|nr:hypothetical protein [Nitrososphaerota archaeon]